MGSADGPEWEYQVHPGRRIVYYEHRYASGIGQMAERGYMLARPAASIGRGVGTFAFNRGVGALGLLGDTGQAWRAGIRNLQIKYLAWRANRILGLRNGTLQWSYSPTRAWYGTFWERTGAIEISEAAFTPSLREMLLLERRARRAPWLGRARRDERAVHALRRRGPRARVSGGAAREMVW